MGTGAQEFLTRHGTELVDMKPFDHDKANVGNDKKSDAGTKILVPRRIKMYQDINILVPSSWYQVLGTS